MIFALLASLPVTAVAGSMPSTMVAQAPAPKPVVPVTTPPIAPLTIPPIVPPASTTQQRQVLTQSDENALEKGYFNDQAKAKARGDFIGLAWPILILFVLVLFRRTIETIALNRKWTLALPGGVNVSVTDQLNNTPSATEKAQAVAALSTVTGPASVPAGAQAAPAAASQAIFDASSSLNQYFQKAASKMLASQLMLLRALTYKQTDRQDAYSMYSVSVARGVAMTFKQWLQYPSEFDLIKQAGLFGQTIQITDLGKQFVTWCNANGISESSLSSEGRGA